MSIRLINMPPDVWVTVNSFLPAAGVLTRNISKTLTEAFDKQSTSWMIAARQYGFKIVDPTKAKEECKAQYEALKKANQVLLKAFPFLKCSHKDPVKVNREIAEKVKEFICCDPDILKGAANLASQLTTQKDRAPTEQALITVLKNYNCEDLPTKIIKKLSDNPSPELLDALLDNFSRGETSFYKPLLYSIVNGKFNIVDAIFKKYKYTPSETHIRTAILMIKNAEHSKRNITKEILKTMFQHASEPEKKEINKLILAEKANPTNPFELAMYQQLCESDLF